MNKNVIDTALPKFGWKVKFNHVFPERRSQDVKPRPSQIVPFIPLAFRYLFHYFDSWRDGRQPTMNYLKLAMGKQMYGVPLGGIGGGTIGRGFRGEFCRFQMRPGIYEYQTIMANQFIVTVQNVSGQTVYQQVLSPHRKPSSGLSSWQWGFSGENGQYYALYPRSWTVYEIPEHKIRLLCRQVSPVIPHNYKDTSIPGAVFVWTVENNNEELLYVSITFTFKNGTGEKEDRAGGCWTEVFDIMNEETMVSGIKLHQTIGDMMCTLGVASVAQNGVRVSHSNFDPCGQGKELWEDLLIDGELDPPPSPSQKTRVGEQLACAVCVKMEVAGGQTASAEIALVWDMPKVHFGKGKRKYFRFYTKYFGADELAAPALCSYVLNNYKKWEEAIESWQNPILNDLELPDWYKSAIFNELYYVADGGTVWFVAEERERLDTFDPRYDHGRFAYLEGHEYRMFNTYDVHFYASFALACNWPMLQASLQYDISDAIVEKDESQRAHLYDGKVACRKVLFSVPHDLGDPNEEPYLLTNAYPIHDVSEWRDLNLKFVLQTYRDYMFIKDIRYLRDMYKCCRCVMDKAAQWDKDGDGLIENLGTPDQTYDTWVMNGPSAYCGSLWLAALYAMIKMSEVLDEQDYLRDYKTLFDKGKVAFEEKLWNGEYYKFDASGAAYSNTIMADQLCGQWYLQACGVKDEVFSAANVKSALKKVFDFNVMKFKNGTMGAVNGMMPNGCVDTVTVQSEEVWTGVVYALAALMIHEGMVEEAFKTASGIYETVYNRIGLGFETPEALYAEKHYRAIGYMRPLSIWAMQHAWEQRKKEKQT